MIEHINEILNYTLFHYNGVKITPISIGIVVAILAGTKFLVRFIKQVILKKYAARDEGRSESLFQIIKYFIWVVSILIALQSVGVNLSILLAGSAALMVGIGLGLQNIFNDFSSGIFILIEGTIKSGDIIETSDGIIGEVKEIRLRTTKVLTRDDTILIVPNHKFISDPILNWTENDWNTRFRVKVGVAYGSDVQLVKKCLLQAVTSHDQVSSKPEPSVLFLDFGESSLDFEVLFYTVNNFRVMKIQSDLRFEIDRLFRENNITIPFPQRDLHIISGEDKIS